MKTPVYKITGLVLAVGLVVGLSIAFVPGLIQQENPVPEGDIVALGKAIFFDENLSQPAGQSCASCHDPKSGFADPDTNSSVSEGAIKGRFANRNAPSVSYAMFSPSLSYDPTKRPGIMEGMYVGGLFWDGRVNSLEDQAKLPFLNTLEMNSSKETVVKGISNSEYSSLFKKIFGPLSLKDVDTAYEYVAQALAAYLRSPEVNPFTSKFDYWKAGQVQFTESEMRGFMLFTNTEMMGAKCANCHTVSDDESQSRSLFTNFGHQNLGTPRNPELPYYLMASQFNPAGVNYVDHGLGDYLRSIGVAEEQAAKEDGKFKIPSLRNCAVTAPYEHNGVFQTLKEVVMFNNTRDVAEANNPAPEVPQNVHRHMPVMPRTFGQLGLTEQQVDDIVAFLHTLTDGYQPKP